MGGASITRWICIQLLLLLLLGWLVISSSSGMQFVNTQLSTHGTISYSSEGNKKTITWADNTIETIEVDNKGIIYLNGLETIAFGFHIVTGLPSGQNNQIKMLDTCASWGVRFMSLDLSSWFSISACQAWIDWWMPQLYAHKMFVEFAMQESPAGNLDVATQFARFSALIDLIDNQKWANMIYGVTYAWELDLGSFNHNSAQLDAYLTGITPLIKNKLANSLIGKVPLYGKMVAPQSPYGSEQFFEHCEIVGYDYYVNPTDMPANCIERFNLYRQLNAVNGKTGYHIWLQENGVLPSYGANWRPYDPNQFQYVLSGGGQNDVSELMIWCLNWDVGGYAFPAFDLNGNPYQWILALVPYFP